MRRTGARTSAGRPGHRTAGRRHTFGSRHRPCRPRWRGRIPRCASVKQNPARPWAPAIIGAGSSRDRHVRRSNCVTARSHSEGNCGEVAPMKVGVVKEVTPGERRVALTPDAVGRLGPGGIDVLVESGAGDGAWFPDSAYAEAGATVVSRGELLTAAEAIVTVGKPEGTVLAGLRAGQAVFGMLAPLTDPDLAAGLAARGVTAISLDGLPRTLSRAQQMDALTSQSNVAGYKAVLVAASAFGRFFPLLITAAGTARPAKVLVLGTGVAGLQAIGTARRLGAVVTGYDVRPSSKSEVESLGATFLELKSVTSAAGEGGYARELTEDERRAQQVELSSHIAAHDVVITTAQVPGRRPPLLVTEDTVKAMAAGSVIVDMSAST